MATGNNKNLDKLMNKINTETGRSDAEEILRLQATKNFEKSCNLCCYHGYHLSCRHCHIEGAHETVIKMLAEKKKTA